MATQLEIPELALASNEDVLRRAWQQVPRVSAAQFDAYMQLPFVRTCLLHVAQAQLKKEARACRRKCTKS